MPRRSGHDLSIAPRPATRATGLAAVALALGVAACQSADPGAAGCQITGEVAVPSSPLTLLANARLERVGTSFALTGVDGATVRWASFEPASGALGAEQTLALPAVAAGPWVALSSQKAPGDMLLIAVAVAAPNGADAELHVLAVPSAAPPAAAPALGPVFAVIPGALANGATPTVALGASRAGPHAALAWLDPAAGGVTELLLSAAGEPIGNPTVLETGPAFGCLAFAPGKSALTLVYHRYPDPASRTPHFFIKELLDAGGVDSTLELILDSHAATCPQLTSTDAGYAIAFQDTEASWLGVYDGATNGFSVNPFAAAAAFGGAALQPPLVGLAPMGADFAVVLDRIHGGELWRLTASGGHRPGRLSLPSAQGAIGGISTQSDSGIMTATYADYSAVSGGVGTAGQRFFLSLTCQ